MDFSPPVRCGKKLTQLDWVNGTEKSLRIYRYAAVVENMWL